MTSCASITSIVHFPNIWLASIEIAFGIGEILIVFLAASEILVAPAIWIIGVKTLIENKMTFCQPLAVGCIIGVSIAHNRRDIGATLDSLRSKIGKHLLWVGELTFINCEGLVVMLDIDIHMQTIQWNLTLAILAYSLFQILSPLIAITSLVIAQHIARFQPCPTANFRKGINNITP